jgi:membrane-bound serine protease (ClpP class)
MIRSNVRRAAYNGAMKRCLTALVLMVLARVAGAAPGEVQVVELRGTIHPISAAYIESAIEAADKAGAAALILEMDTPGGVVDDTKEIVQHIWAAKTPVIGYVTPSGARAASGGFMLLIACDIAAMSPGTNTGAAHPIQMGGDNRKENIEIQKAESDVAAFARTAAENRGRNVALAEKGVTESASWTEKEALEGKLIEVIAKDRADLLRQLEGRTIKRWSGETTVLRLTGPVVPSRAMTALEKFQSFLVNPLIVSLLLSLGILGIYVEVTHPGVIVPGIVGGLSLLLFFYASRLLPVNFVGLAFIALAMTLFVLELKIVSHGLLGLGGVVCLAAGFLLLFNGPIPEMRLPVLAVLPTSLALGALMFFILRYVVAAQRERVATGREGMIGEIGVAETDLAPEGRIFVHGEYWNARASGSIARGSRVRVRSVDDMLLHVEAEGRSA